MKIQDVLGGTSRRVYTVDPGDTIADTIDMLAEYGIGAVVVTKDKKQILGIMSERDVVRHLCREQEHTLRLKVEDLMTEDVKTCGLDATIESAMGTMTAGRFRHMPVVNADNELCALISLGDLVDARLKELEAQNIELRELAENT